MKVKTLKFLLVLIAFSQFTKAQNKSNNIIGTWLTPGKDPAKIEIYKNGELFLGKITWLKIPNYEGKPKVDGHTLIRQKGKSLQSVWFY